MIPLHEFAGKRILSNPHLCRIPIIELRLAVSVSDEFRASFNAWALETFGTKSVAYMIGTGTIVVDPETFAQLKGLK